MISCKSCEHSYINFYNRTGHMTQMFSYTKHKELIKIFIKNWFWQFDKELSSFNQQYNQFVSNTGCGGICK